MVFDLNLEPPDEGYRHLLLNLNEVPAPENGHEHVSFVIRQHAAAVEINDQICHTFDLNMETIDDPDIESLQYVAHEVDTDMEQEVDTNLHDYDVHGGNVHVMFNNEQDDSSEEDVTAPANGYTKYKNMTEKQRIDIYEALLTHSNNGKLKRNSTTVVAQMLNAKIYNVQAVWRRAKQCQAMGIPVDVRSKRIGCKPTPIDLSQIGNIPLHRRTTIRVLAEHLGVKKSSLHRSFKKGMLRRHSNALKPFLKEENKKTRLQFCLAMLNHLTLQNEPTFVDMCNIIHIDEKWFNATKKSRTFYMLPEEEDPHRTIQNKNSIDKVMVLAAVARPLFDEHNNSIFDGKIGVWPFIRKEPAQRSSQNRARGTLVTKSIIVDRNTMRSFLIAKVLPAIRARWPREHARSTIWIQQDNARTHVPCDDEQFATAVAQTGLHIRLMNQPPNSPDMNVLDLGFFASLQSLTYKRISRNIDELIDNIYKEYEEYDANKLNMVFLTLQSCLIEVMKVGGGNRYKIPHMNKARLQRLGNLPKALTCDRELYENVVQLLAS